MKDTPVIADNMILADSSLTLIIGEYMADAVQKGVKAVKD